MLSMIVHVPQPPADECRSVHRTRPRQNIALVWQARVFLRQPYGLEDVTRDKREQHPSGAPDLQHRQNRQNGPEHCDDPGLPNLSVSVARDHRMVAKKMRKGGGGSIISTASVAGLSGRFLLHPCNAAKAAVINLTQTAALELGQDKIRVNCICPGLINTPLTQGGVLGAREVAEKNLRGRPGAQACGSSRRYREHGAVPGERRIRMGDGGGDGR